MAKWLSNESSTMGYSSRQASKSNSSRMPSKSVPSQLPSKVAATCLASEKMSLNNHLTSASNASSSPVAKPSAPGRLRSVIMDKEYEEGTFNCSRYSRFQRTFIDSVPEKNSNLRFSMVATIMPDTKAVVESNHEKNIAKASGSLGLIAQVVVPEKQLRDEEKLRQMVSYARKSFTHDATGGLDAAALAAAALRANEESELQDGNDNETEQSASSGSHHQSLNQPCFKEKRPEKITIPIRSAETTNSGTAALVKSPLSAPACNTQRYDMAGRFGNVCVASQPPGTLHRKVDSHSLLPSSLSPRWLQKLLHDSSYRKGSPSSKSGRSKSGRQRIW